MSEITSLWRNMVDFVFDRHHYILVAIFILFLIFLIIILSVNAGLTPFTQ